VASAGYSQNSGTRRTHSRSPTIPFWIFRISSLETKCSPDLIRSASTAGGGVTADQLEPRLLSSLSGDPAAREEALDALLGALLAQFTELSPRCTDGVVILREDLGATSYFAVGTVFMIKDQARQPVAIELARASAGGGVESGRIRIGIARDSSGTEHQYDRVENALLASPHETAAALAWATLFERDATGWHQRTFQCERSGMAG
jgi:hypothetical protein